MRFLQAYKRNIIFDAERLLIREPEKSFKAGANLIMTFSVVYNYKEQELETWNFIIGYLKACIIRLLEDKIAAKNTN